MTKKMTWDDFCKEFMTNNFIYDLLYNNKVYTLGSEKKRWSSNWTWFLSTQHALNEKPIYMSFNSPQELLANATIDGKNLKNIWNDIVLN